MSLLNIAWRVFAAAAIVVVVAPNVSAQHRELPNGPTYHPFADPLEFDPDWQWFAPVDIESLAEMRPRKRANTGWYGTYDRTYIWMSRPETEDSSDHGDFGWGNRFDLGLMTEDESGWLFSFRSMGGPNVYDRVFQERYDRYNANDTGDPLNPLLPFVDENDPQLGVRAYILGDSLNVAGLTNFEVNKTWRARPYRYGGILEPMVGFKYSTFKDLALNQRYSRNDTNVDGIALPAQSELLLSQETNIKNQMVGGQLGARYFNHYRRWTLSGEFRAFGMANFQQRDYALKSYLTEYGGAPATGVASTQTTYDALWVHQSNREFVYGFEARAEAAYAVTKYIHLRGGLDILDFATGIWRGANPDVVTPGFENRPSTQHHDQTVMMAGFTFGLTLNR